MDQDNESVNYSTEPNDSKLCIDDIFIQVGEFGNLKIIFIS